MPVLHTADAMFVGSNEVDAVYVGADKVWPPPSSSAYADRIMSLNPISYWRLGESSIAAPAVDEMGLHDGIYTGSPTLGVPGLIAGDTSTAMLNDGATAYQGMNGGAGVEYGIGVVTLEAWFKTPNPGSSFRSIFVKQLDYGIFTLDGVIATYVWGSAAVINTGVSIADDVRHHVAVTLQQGVDGGSRFYLDGVAIGAPFAHYSSSHANNLCVGHNDYGGQEFIGVMDEAAIYARNLTPTEIADNYAAGA